MSRVKTPLTFSEYPVKQRREMKARLDSLISQAEEAQKRKKGIDATNMSEAEFLEFVESRRIIK